MPSIAADLLAWYDHNARELPWRSHPTPYTTLVSEVMLQQTQIETVIPYYHRFLERFPDFESLAAASQEEVLSLWEGLGYYSRARNLHKAAQVVVTQHGGQLPSDKYQLLRLPGIGAYSAGAILSIAFGQREPALDGNIRRVYARLMNLRKPLDTTAAKDALDAFSWQTLPKKRAGDYNQALMDLGRTVCTPKNPRCEMCPLCVQCLAYESGDPGTLPVKREKPQVPHWIVTAAVIQKQGKVFVARRPEGGLLGGMWEFPGGKLEETDHSLAACLQREIREELGVGVLVGKQLGTYKHAYTHFRITLHAFFCELKTGETLDESPEKRWLSPNALSDLPMGKVDG